MIGWIHKHRRSSSLRLQKKGQRRDLNPGSLAQGSPHLLPHTAWVPKLRGACLFMHPVIPSPGAVRQGVIRREARPHCLCNMNSVPGSEGPSVWAGSLKNGARCPVEHSLLPHESRWLL